MILLVTPSERAQECAGALHEATGKTVVTAENLSRAATLLQEECYGAVVLDQHLLELEPLEAENTFEHLGTAIPVHVNLAISGRERLVREVRAALQLWKREEGEAREAAIRKLRGELNSTLTALLLSSELALDAPDLPPAAVEKLQSVNGLVQKLRTQLETTLPIF